MENESRLGTFSIFNSRFSIFEPAASVAAITLYVAARCWGLTSSCLWFDEIFSVHAAEHAWDELFSFVALDLIHPPLFYIVLKCWIAIGGDGLLWLRSLPVILSVAAVVPFILVCRELDLDCWASVLALFLLAINGNLIKYAQEVRMYSLLLLVSLLSMWLFVRFFRRGAGLVLLIIVNMLMVYTHYFGWLVVFSEVGAIVVFGRAQWRKAALMTAMLAVGFMPWAFAIWQGVAPDSSLGQNIGWMTRPNIRESIQFVLALIEPFYSQASSIDPASVYRVSVPLFLIGAGALAAYFHNWRQRPAEKQRAARLLISFICLPVGGAFLASWLLPYSVWGTRHLIVVFAPFSILLATAVVSIPRRTFRTAAVTFVVLLSGLAFFNAAPLPTPIYSWCNWEPLAVHAAQVSPVRVFAFEDVVAYHLWFGLRQHGEHRLEVSKVRNMPGVGEDAAYFLPRGFGEIKTIDAADIHDSRFWIAYRSDALDETRQPLKTFINAGYKVADQDVLPATQEKTILLLMEKGS